MPEIRFAKSGDVHIAYQVVGDGPVDLVFIYDWIWNLELQWENPLCVRFLERLSSFSRLLLFDKRGSGLSDRTVDLDLFTLEVRIDDVRAVMEAAASEQAVLFGSGDDGASLAAVFAAANPDRTRALILYGSRAKTLKAPDIPGGSSRRLRTCGPPSARASGGRTPTLADGSGRWLLPWRTTIGRVRWYSRFLRQSASPGTEAAYSRWMETIDLRGMLSAIHVPTLVLHRTGDQEIPIEGGRDVADRIAGASFVELPGIDSFPWAGDQATLLAEIEAFVTGSRATEAADRVLATVLFTDIVGSTSRAAEIGDARWKELRRDPRREGEGRDRRFRGRYVKQTGDGLLATFDGPARAVRCAGPIGDAVGRSASRSGPGATPARSSCTSDNVRGITIHIGAG